MLWLPTSPQCCVQEHSQSRLSQPGVKNNSSATARDRLQLRVLTSTSTPHDSPPAFSCLASNRATISFPSAPPWAFSANVRGITSNADAKRRTACWASQHRSYPPDSKGRAPWPRHQEQGEGLL